MPTKKDDTATETVCARLFKDDVAELKRRAEVQREKFTAVLRRLVHNALKKKEVIR